MGLIDTIKNIIAPSKKDERHEQRTFGTAPAMGSAVEVNEDKALTFTAVWAAIRLLSESVSSLPINVYEIDKNGNKVVATANPIYNLLKYKPNNFQNKITFLELLMMGLAAKGESFFYIERNQRTVPTQLIPLNFDEVDVVLSLIHI